jgi:very-long-chain enoyl-CoA reductase
MIVLHFLKREYESVFVHRFSNATMPLWNIFKNCIHYWILSGILLAFFIYSTSAPAAQQIRPSLTYSGLAIWVLGEYGNLKTHSILRDLRAPGTNKRGVPSGLGFDLVTCPNYMFETIAWVGILLISRSWATVIFIIGSVGQMSIWARKKETRYRTEFKETYKRKKFGMIPGIC